MSRWPAGGRRTTANLLTLDVRTVVRAALADPAPFGHVVHWTGGSTAGASVDFENAVLVLTYSRKTWAGAARRCEQHRISLDSTRPRYGGRRWWARCPGCDGRRALLYLDGPGPRCRRCADLAYVSTRDDAFGLAIRRRDRARARLGAPPGRGPLPPCPPGRWRSRWDRLATEALEAERAALGILDGWLERMEKCMGVRAAPRRDPCKALSPCARRTRVLTTSGASSSPRGTPASWWTASRSASPWPSASSSANCATAAPGPEPCWRA